MEWLIPGPEWNSETQPAEIGRAKQRSTVPLREWNGNKTRSLPLLGSAIESPY